MADVWAIWAADEMVMVSRSTLRRLGWRGVCQDMSCPCWVPHEVCEEFMGSLRAPAESRCPRCGWPRKDHDG